MVLYYITSPCITSRYITLHYITLQTASVIRETTEMLGQQIENNANEILAAASGERGAIVDAAHSQAYTKVV